MSTAETAVRYFAEFWHGVQVTRYAEGARRENWVKITVPRQGPDPIARFTAPHEPGSRRIGHDDLLHANGWTAVGPWEYVAGPNAYRAPVEPLRPLITAGQSAVRAAEEHGSPETVRGLDKALCALPLTGMDDHADGVLHEALRAVSLAEDAEEWTLLTDVEHQVSRFLHEPDGATLEHPAVRAVVVLTSQCGNRYGKRVEDPIERRTWYASPERHAWNRAFLFGLEALGELSSAIGGSDNGRALDKAMTKFLTAVRRAIPYAALRETRRALVEAARAYGVFVIGMRQPMPTERRWEWFRCIGSAVYHFEVVPPLVEGFAYGSVAVRRTAEDGTAGPVRYLSLGADEERRRAVTEAQYRI